MTDLDTLFADLRGLMQRDRLGAAARRDVWRILHRAWRDDPHSHAEQLVPYAAGFPHHFTDALVTAYAPEHLELAARVAPFATFGLRVDLNTLTDLDASHTARVTRLDAVHLSARQTALLGAPGRFPNLRRLALVHTTMNGRQLADFIAGAPFDALTRLDLSDNRIAPASAAALFEVAPFENLTHLNLKSCNVGNAALKALANNPVFSNLTRLDAFDCNLSNPAAIALAQSPHLTRLRHLDLSGNHIAARGARALAQSPNVASLTHLDLSDCELYDQGTVALAGSPHLSTLEELRLSYDGVEDAGLDAFSAPTCALTSLTRLDLSINEFSVSALGAFARSDMFTRLTHLDLSDHHLDDLDAASRRGASTAVARALFHGDAPLALTHLALRENDLSHTATELITSSPNLGRLRRLDLGDNALTMSGARALVDASNLGALRELSLAGCALKGKAVDELARGGALSRLTHLDLARAGLNPDRASALLAPDPFPWLIDLDLTEARLTHALAAALSGLLPRLERLVLNGCDFQRGELAALLRGSDTPPLLELQLRDTTLDESDLRAISASSRLRRLHLPYDEPRLSASALLDYATSLPDLALLAIPWPALDPSDPRLAFVRVDDTMY